MSIWPTPDHSESTGTRLKEFSLRFQNSKSSVLLDLGFDGVNLRLLRSHHVDLETKSQQCKIVHRDEEGPSPGICWALNTAAQDTSFILDFLIT